MDATKRPHFTRPGRRPPGRKCPRVRKVEPHSGVVGYVCSHEEFDVYTHWNPEANCSEPCVNGKDLCPGCLAFMPIRYKAYLHCYSDLADEEFFIEMTALAMEKLEKLTASFESYRGLAIEFRRENNTKKSTIVCKVVGSWTKKDKLPEPKTPELTLMSLYGLDFSA